MSIFEWSHTLELGIEVIDSQHKGLLKTMNKLSLQIALGKDNQGFIEAAKEMSAYVDCHFEAEEKLMRESNFPGIDAHVLEHQKFAKKAASFTVESFEESPQRPRKLLAYLLEWLVDHIMGTDMIFAQYYLATIKE